jgi:glucose 1-dehydrogenase
LEKIPWGRIGQPSDIANAVAFVASDDASYITGTTIYVDGAMTQYPEFQKGAV